MKPLLLLLPLAFPPSPLLAGTGVPQGQMPYYTALGSFLGARGVLPGWEDGQDRSRFDPYLPALGVILASLPEELQPKQDASVRPAEYDAVESRLRTQMETALAKEDDLASLWRNAEFLATEHSQAQANQHLALFGRLLAAYGETQDEATRGPLLAQVAEMDEFARYRSHYLRGPVTVQSLYARILEGLSPHRGHPDVLDKLHSLLPGETAPGGEVSLPGTRASSPPRLRDEREAIRYVTLRFAQEHGAQHLLVLGSRDILSVRPDGSVEPYQGPELGIAERMRVLRMTELFLRELHLIDRPPQVVDLNGNLVTLDPHGVGPMIRKEIRMPQPAPGESNWDFLRRLLGPQPSLARRVLFYAVAALAIAGAVALGLLLLRP